MTKEELDSAWKDYVAAARLGDFASLSAIYETLEPAEKEAQGARKLKAKS